MSITMRIVEVVDKLRLNQYFVQKDNRTYFSPIHIKLNAEVIEKGIDSIIGAKGKPYKPNELEKQVLKELDF